MNGYVRFEYKGKAYEGFISQIERNAAWEQDSKWVLLKR
jgi:hypothetical protein